MAQYTYGYKTEDPGQATYSEQTEQRNGNAVTGFYSTLLPDGRVQVGTALMVAGNHWRPDAGRSVWSGTNMFLDIPADSLDALHAFR